MRATYCQLKILIIDEVSMVGAQTFSNVYLTLQEIFENEEPFGNISVYVVGDLMQLNPVGEKTSTQISNNRVCSLGFFTLGTFCYCMN